jgi:hypothetical protein
MTAFEDTFGMVAMKGELIRDEALMLHAYKDPGSGGCWGGAQPHHPGDQR